MRTAYDADFQKVCNKIISVGVNEKLVAEGYAHASTYPPDVAYSQLFIEKERLARENKLGLWGERASEQSFCKVGKEVF